MAAKGVKLQPRALLGHGGRPQPLPALPLKGPDADRSGDGSWVGPSSKERIIMIVIVVAIIINYY